MINFTESQQRTIARALTALSLVVVFAFAAAVVWLLAAAFSFASAAILPVIVGFFLAIFFRPYYHWWVKRVRNPTVALVLMLLTVFIPLGLFLWYAGAVIVDQIANLIAQGPELVRHVIHWFSTTFPQARRALDMLGVPYDRIGEIYTNYGGAALKAGSGVLKCLMGVVSILVTLIFFGFFLITRERRGGELIEHLPLLKPEMRKFAARQIDTFVEILVSFFQRQTIICLIEGGIYGIGFMLVGLPYGLLIGFAIGIFNLIPFLGSLVFMPIALPLAYFAAGGSLLRLILVVSVWGAVQLMDGYLITPKIQGDKTGLGYAGVIFSFFFWSIVLGPLTGMLLAIPLSAFCVVFWQALMEKAGVKENGGNDQSNNQSGPKSK